LIGLRRTCHELANEISEGLDSGSVVLKSESLVGTLSGGQDSVPSSFQPPDGADTLFLVGRDQAQEREAGEEVEVPAAEANRPVVRPALGDQNHVSDHRHRGSEGDDPDP
jgi:hypothetical protein